MEFISAIMQSLVPYMFSLPIFKIDVLSPLAADLIKLLFTIYPTPDEERDTTYLQVLPLSSRLLLKSSCSSVVRALHALICAILDHA